MVLDQALAPCGVRFGQLEVSESEHFRRECCANESIHSQSARIGCKNRLCSSFTSYEQCKVELIMPTIAKRELIGQRADGERFNIVMHLGEPYQESDVSWACPVGLDGIDRRLPDIRGIDSWQSLLLAISLVRSRLEHFVETGGKLYWLDQPSLEIALHEIFGKDA